MRPPTRMPRTLHRYRAGCGSWHGLASRTTCDCFLLQIAAVACAHPHACHAPEYQVLCRPGLWQNGRFRERRATAFSCRDSRCGMRSTHTHAPLHPHRYRAGQVWHGRFPRERRATAFSCMCRCAPTHTYVNAPTSLGNTVLARFWHRRFPQRRKTASCRCAASPPTRMPRTHIRYRTTQGSWHRRFPANDVRTAFSSPAEMSAVVMRPPTRMPI
jgi:hypothetical protein